MYDINSLSFSFRSRGIQNQPRKKLLSPRENCSQLRNDIVNRGNLSVLCCEGLHRTETYVLHRFLSTSAKGCRWENNEIWNEIFPFSWIPIFNVQAIRWHRRFPKFDFIQLIIFTTFFLSTNIPNCFLLNFRKLVSRACSLSWKIFVWEERM